MLEKHESVQILEKFRFERLFQKLAARWRHALCYGNHATGGRIYHRAEPTW